MLTDGQSTVAVGVLAEAPARPVLDSRPAGIPRGLLASDDGATACSHVEDACRVNGRSPLPARSAASSERLATIARTLDTGSVHETLQLIVDHAVATVPGCHHAGISFVHRVHHRRISTAAASDAVALRVDRVQVEVDQGPGLDAMLDDQIRKSDDLAGEGRWPRFASRAHAETGVRSMLGIRLFARSQTMGTLTLMASRPAAFDLDAQATAAVFAAMAAVALHAAQTEESLKLALDSRDVIGQAMGILMERHRITDTAAFQRLKTASQTSNVRLKDLASQIVLTGVGPTAHN